MPSDMINDSQLCPVDVDNEVTDNNQHKLLVSSINTEVKTITATNKGY